MCGGGFGGMSFGNGKAMPYQAPGATGLLGNAQMPDWGPMMQQLQQHMPFYQQRQQQLQQFQQMQQQFPGMLNHAPFFGQMMQGMPGMDAGGAVPTPGQGLTPDGMATGGMIKSPVPGRTDKLPISVGGGAYVLPADHVAALGEGNSMAGGHILDRMFKASNPRLRRRAFASGGPVDIIAAGGEYVVPPEVVAQIGGGDMNRGHGILDKWVLQTRRAHIKTLRNLKPPKE